MERAITIGSTVRQITSDDIYLEQMGPVFEPHMTALFQTLISPEMVVADIGANIGMTALLFSDLASSVYAFEPSPSTFGILKANLDRAGVGNVESVNIGMGEIAQEQTLTFAKANRSGGFVSEQIRPQNDAHTTEAIHIDTLDGYFAARTPLPDFIKLDVEGFEPRVLRGAQAIIANQEPVVVLELNHFCLNVMHRVTLPDFFDQLRATFPVLLAVDTDNKRIADLHNPDAAYTAMLLHATQFRFPNIVAGFSDEIRPRLRDMAAEQNGSGSAP